MPKRKDVSKVIETDVLVIGGGIGGLWAANRARAFVPNVLVVDKGPPDWVGLASMAFGGLTAVFPEDDVSNWVQDLVYYYDGLCEQDIVEKIFEQFVCRLSDYQTLGYRLARNADGTVTRIPQRGLPHYSTCFGVPLGQGGLDLRRIMIAESDRLSVKRLGRVLVTDLLQSNGAVVGAVGFDTRSGEFYVFRARAVVLATGLGGWKASYHKNTVTGEGICMAFRAGAELKNCEFAYVWNVPKRFAWEGQAFLLPLGAKFINKNGEAFLDKYSPRLSANTDVHYVTMAMAFEARDGKGPFYLDCSALKKEDKELNTPKSGWTRINYERLLDLHMNFFEDKLEWIPQLWVASGGVKADVEGRTGVPGLFVGSRARNVDPGVRTGGWGIATATVLGYIAGESAGQYAKWHDLGNMQADEVGTLRSQLYALLGKTGASFKKALRQVQEAVFPYDVCVLKNGVSLKRALDEIQRIKEEVVPQVGAPDPHFLLKLIEVQGIVFTTEMFLRASLMRTESRAGHFREDYPSYDDQNWLKWIVIGKENGNLSFHTEPVPIKEYKFKPVRHYMDNFAFPVGNKQTEKIKA